MSGWQLGLALLGCWLAGLVFGFAALGVYGRVLLRRRLHALPGQLLQTTTTMSGSSATIDPPPPRRLP